MAFRADASNHMGIGHLMRCLTLAESLRARDVETQFICRAHAGNLIELLERRGIPVTALPAGDYPAESAREDYAQWLGVPSAQDARETIAALGGARPQWLVVDHYGLGESWERAVRPHVERMMVIDDLPQRRHDCDLLLDQNESGVDERSYRARVGEHCLLALGPRHALLRPEYSHRRVREHRGSVSRVLVFFGGSDPHNLTGRALEALSDPEFKELNVDVVVGANNPHRSQLERTAAARPRTRVLGPQSHLADLMVEADLAIGAGGSTTWERMCVGLPSIVVSIAENQRPGCEVLAQRGLIRYLGTSDEVSAAHLVSALRECIGSSAALVELAEKGMALVDGAGAPRIGECLHATPPDLLELRRALDPDVYVYFAWANDPDVRRQSLSPEPISLQQHRRWFAAKLAAPESQLYVLLAGHLPVGQIRFDREGATLRIDYSIDPLCRGRGWARRLVSLGMRAAAASAPVRFLAEVKRGNPASASVFRRLGFAESVSADGELSVFVLDSASGTSLGGH